MASNVTFYVERVKNGGFIIRDSPTTTTPALAAVTTAQEVATYIDSYAQSMEIPGVPPPPPPPPS
jgi:hypothetical protein